MENKTAFDLTVSIAMWRAKLALSPAFRTADLDELESHLRDGIQDLESRVLSSEEAFTIAVHRIGGVPALSAEFARGNGHAQWLDPALYMLAGWVCLSTVQSMIQTIGVFLELIKYMSFLPALFVTFVWIAPLLLITVIAVSVATRSGDFLSSLRDWLQRPMPLATAAFVGLLLPAAFRVLSTALIVGGERSWNMLRQGRLATIVMGGPAGARYIAASSLLVAFSEWMIVALFILILAKRRQRIINQNY